MRHWNGHLMCAIDVETTGVDSYFDTIWQIAIVPLDFEFNPMRHIQPFYLIIQPENIDHINYDSETMQKLKPKIRNAVVNGYTPDGAIGLFYQWFDNLKMPVNKFGNLKKLMPLGHNYAFDKAFISKWLSAETYDQFFDYHFRDTMQSALLMNDIAASRGNKVPFSKVTLSWLCKELNVENADAHDALHDCVATAQVYQRLVQRFPLLCSAI